MEERSGNIPDRSAVWGGEGEGGHVDSPSDSGAVVGAAGSWLVTTMMPAGCGTTVMVTLPILQLWWGSELVQPSCP